MGSQMILDFMDFMLAKMRNKLFFTSLPHNREYLSILLFSFRHNEVLTSRGILTINFITSRSSFLWLHVVSHNIIKLCPFVHVDPKKYNDEMPQPNARRLRLTQPTQCTFIKVFPFDPFLLSISMQMVSSIFGALLVFSWVLYISSEILPKRIK